MTAADRVGGGLTAAEDMPVERDLWWGYLCPAMANIGVLKQAQSDLIALGADWAEAGRILSRVQTFYVDAAHGATLRYAAALRDREAEPAVEGNGTPCPKHRARGVNVGCPDCDQHSLTADREAADKGADDGLRARVEAVIEPASDDEGLRDYAYYFGFTQTGVGIIDRILSEVCRAGKGYHSTESWQDVDPLVSGGKSYEDSIQEAADAAASALRALAAPDSQEQQ